MMHNITHCASTPVFIITAQSGIKINLEHTIPYDMYLTLLLPAFIFAFFQLSPCTFVQFSHTLTRFPLGLDDVRAVALLE